jgi:hypothetical protein
LKLVERYREETDSERYHQAAWAVVRQPYLYFFQYRFALRQAEAACRQAAQEGKYRLTLGIAQYRAAQYPQALETLGGIEWPHEDIPAMLAFRAMTQHRLGQKDGARATLERLQKAVTSPAWRKNDDALTLWREAKAVVTDESDGLP